MAKPYVASAEERPLDGLYDFNFTFSALQDVSQHISKRIAPRMLPVRVITGTHRTQEHSYWQHRQQQENQQQVLHPHQYVQAQQRKEREIRVDQRTSETRNAMSADAALVFSQQPIQQQQVTSDGNATALSLPSNRDFSNLSSAGSSTKYVFEYTYPPQALTRRSSVPASWQGITEKDKECGKVWGEVRHRFFTYNPSERGPPASAANTQSSCRAERESKTAKQVETTFATTQSRRDSVPARNDGHVTRCCVATQSIYRDQEAQTVPYSAAVVIPASQHPEEMTISHLCWQNGLPATQHEIAVIQKLRQKRKIERLLPPATDEYSFHLRAALMEEQEFREWADREKQLKDLQDRRLELFREALRKRAASALRRENEVLSRTESRLKEGEFLLALKKEKERIKVVRTLWREKQQLEESLTPTRWKAISNSCSRSSPLYAPKSMNGYVPDDPYSSLNLDAPGLKDYEELVQLRKALDKAHPTGSWQANKKTSHARKAEARLKQALDSMALRLRQEAAREQASKDLGTNGGLDVSSALLDAATVSLQHVRESHASAAKKLYMRNIRERPETPRVEEVLPEDEELQVAVILLQRVLRGQACQQRMYEGKEKRLDLINFLRASEQLSDIPVEEQEALAIRDTKQELFEVLTASFQGYAICQTLDELAKELRKVQEERRIAAMVALAERDRRLREAQESGTRQAEELLRAREDESFRRIMTLHHQTVDSYVESILSSSVDHVAHQQALKEARSRAEQLSQVVDAVEERYKDPVHISRELVTSFLLPHVKKQQLQRQRRHEEEKFSLAVRYGVGESFRALCPEHGSLF